VEKKAAPTREEVALAAGRRTMVKAARDNIAAAV